MVLLLYKSALCPRCHLTRKYLEELLTSHPQVEIQTVDIATSPRRFRRDGITMIPTLRIGENRLAMLVPTRERIRDFLVHTQLL